MSKETMKSKKGIAGSAVGIGIILLLVKGIGFIKQAFIAAFFGASMEMDIYIMAIDLVSGISACVFSVISVGLVTMYLEVKDKDETQNILVSNVMLIFGICSIVIILCMNLFAGGIARVIAPGYTQEQLQRLEYYLRISSVIIFNTCISYTCIGVLDAEKKFTPGKVIGIFLSISLIGACVLLGNKIGILALVVGNIVYYIVENIFLLCCITKKVKFKIKNPFKDKHVHKLLRLSIPLFISNSAVYVAAIVDKSVASSLVAGSVTALSYGHYLLSFVHAVVIGSLCTVIYSYISTYIVQNNRECIIDILFKSISIVLLLMAYISIVSVINSNDIIRMIYGRGKFDEQAIEKTALALIGYSIGFIFIGIRDILIRVHYAYQDTNRPMINGLIEIGINIALSIVLGRFWGVFGIAFASSCSMIITCIISNHTLKCHLKEYRFLKLKADIIKIIVAGICCGLVVSLVSRLAIRNVFIKLVCVSVLGGIAYIIVLVILQQGEILFILDKGKKILKKLLKRSPKK